jgi:hypothetical protein
MLMLGAATAIAAAACGAGDGDVSSTVSSRPATAGVAAAIKARLQKAGYSVVPENYPPRSTPHPVRSFKIQVDFATPESFDFDVFVFDTPAQAALVVRRFTAAEKAFRKQSRVVADGRVVYVGSTGSASAVLPVADFKKTLAEAEGRTRLS